jgi:phosphoheptose isomerase
MSIFDKDPGIKNKINFQSDGKFDVKAYLENFKSKLDDIPKEKINIVAKKIDTAIKNKKRVFFCGNGGSFSIAEHMVCDYVKGLQRFYDDQLLFYNIGVNTALNSALTNDFGHESAYATELKMYAHSGDILIAISSSGNSVNILNLVEISKKIGVYSVGLSGFDGGKLKNIVDISYVAECYNYPTIEALHQIFLDCVALNLWRP